MNREERILKYINSSDDFVINGKRYCENDFYNDVEDLVKQNKKYKEVIDKVIEEIKKELKENNHLSYGVALSIIVMLNYYEEILKEVE